MHTIETPASAARADAYPVRIIRPDTAAASAGVCLDVIHWAVRTGALRMVKIGRRATGIRVADFEEWIASLPAVDKAA